MSKAKTCYNLDLLKQCMERDSPKDVEIPDKLNRDVKIKFTCPCGSEGLCSFRYLYKIGMKCFECKKIIGKDKIKQTNLKKLGVEYSFQSKEVREKIKQTNLKNLGVENPFQSKEVKEKIKQTNLKTYGSEHHNQTILGKEIRKQTNLKNLGVENPFQSKEIQEKIKQTNLKKLGVEYPSQRPQWKQLVKETSLKRYGVNFYSQSDLAKSKTKQTNLKTYGAEYHTQTESVKEKIRQSNIRNHGVEHVFQSEKIKEKNKQIHIKNYGVANPFQSKEIKDKIKKGFMETYGVEHPQQVPEIFEKSQKTAFKLKPYTFPSGKEVKIQGYENHALDKLLQTYQEEDLTIGASLVPKIIYTHQQKTKRYYPDIYIPKDNLIIEVKSKYTLKRELEKNLAKRRACIDQGYDFKFWIFHRGQLVQEVNREDPESCILVQSS